MQIRGLIERLTRPRGDTNGGDRNISFPTIKTVGYLLQKPIFIAHGFNRGLGQWMAKATVSTVFRAYCMRKHLNVW